MGIALIVLIAVAFFVVLVGASAAKDAMDRNSRRGDWAIFVVRWLTGGHWTGRPQTNAGWKRKGTKALTQTGFALPFYFRPRLHRLGLRLAWTFGPVAALYGLLTNQRLTVGALAVLTVALLVLAVWRISRAIARRTHRREWTEPLHESIAPLAGVPLSARPSSWIELSEDRTNNVFHLPPSFNDSELQRKRLAEVASKRLGLEAPEITWDMSGKEPTLTLSASTMPTDVVRLADVRKYITRAAKDVLVVGLGLHSDPVDISLHEDSPHVGASMGAGAGKSTLARFLAAQALHKGAIVLILDIKKISHPWARGLPNVAYCDTPALIHEALIWMGTELDRRDEVALYSSDVEGNIEAEVGPRLFVVAEELNMTANRLRSYWKDTLGGQGVSPALTALQDVAFAGRQVMMNLFMVGQMLTARVTGGTSGGNEARENVGIRMLARFTKKAWEMLVPEFPMPPNSNVLGRIQVVASGAVRACQVAYITGAQARELAMTGEIGQLPAGMPESLISLNNFSYQGTTKHNELEKSYTNATNSEQNSPVDDSQPVTLAEAVARGIINYKIGTLRQYRRSDAMFPNPVTRPANGNPLAHYYDPAELTDYELKRRKK